MAKTKIEWATDVWNPITGCDPISAGCENCYARRMANRLRGRFGYPKDDPFKVTYHDGFNGTSNRLTQPLRWIKHRRIFVCSMGDLFHKDVWVDWIDSIYGMIEMCRQHTFVVLTKRPENIEEKLMVFYHNKKRKLFTSKLPKNLWLGVTAENKQTADERIPILLQIPAAVRFVSVEPMLERIDLTLSVGSVHLDWIICGAETGPGARLMNLDWARDLRDQCKAADIPFFFKSAGKQKTPDDLKIREFPTNHGRLV